MFKKALISILLAGFVLTGFTACAEKNDSASSSNNKPFKEESTEKSEKESKTKEEAGPIEGLPKGFPSSIPFYKGARIIDAGEYGDNGYNVVYSVNADYDKVVEFYMDRIDGLSDTYVVEDEAYFEDIDLNDIHINGLTITDVGDGTHVFITLHDNSSGGQDGEDNNEYDDYDESDSEAYGDAYEVELDSDYPIDVVPIYPEAKVVSYTSFPGGGATVDLLLPPENYDDAVTYYEKELKLAPKNFTSPAMTYESFEGEIKGYDVTVQVAKVVNVDPMIHILITK